MIDLNELLLECKYKTSRSSGAGGQHVNKVETRVTIIFNISESKILDESQIEMIFSKLNNIISKKGILQISSQKYKSQIKNKTDAETKFIEIMEKALKIPKKRKKIKISKEAKLKRLNDKKLHSDKKKSRIKPEIKYE